MAMRVLDKPPNRRAGSATMPGLDRQRRRVLPVVILAALICATGQVITELESPLWWALSGFTALQALYWGTAVPWVLRGRTSTSSGLAINNPDG